MSEMSEPDSSKSFVLKQMIAKYLLSDISERKADASTFIHL